MIKELVRHGRVLIDESPTSYRIRIGREVLDGVDHPVWANGIAFDKSDLADLKCCIDEIAASREKIE